MATTLNEAALGSPPPAPETRPLRGPDTLLTRWLGAQALNTSRHANALRPFEKDEFGTGIAAPSEGHIETVNALMGKLRAGLLALTGRTASAASLAARKPVRGTIHDMLRGKERAHHYVQAIEKIWDFYFELFGQRQGRYGDWLVGCDRIALDCYQEAFMGTAASKSIPAPPAFCYMRTGFSPSTLTRFRRVKRLGQLNPFPLIQLPYHRLVNPWTLGAVLHEVSHNLQNDLGLSKAIPLAIAKRLLRSGFNHSVVATWTRWNRETFADLSAVLLGGPAIIVSLMDVLGRGPETVVSYSPTAPHPTPFLRAFLSIEVLKRMGFDEEAARHRRMWLKLYSRPRGGNIPRPILDSFGDVFPLVVDTMCYQPYREMGGKSLSEVYRFQPKEQLMIEEAAKRLAEGTDPGVIPARFLIGASRTALDRKMATPSTIAKNFYKELARR